MICAPTGLWPLHPAASTRTSNDSPSNGSNVRCFPSTRTWRNRTCEHSGSDEEVSADKVRLRSFAIDDVNRRKSCHRECKRCNQPADIIKTKARLYVYCRTREYIDQRLKKQR